jgi:hypothetical protein
MAATLHILGGCVSLHYRECGCASGAVTFVCGCDLIVLDKLWMKFGQLHWASVGAVGPDIVKTSL